MIIQRTYDFIPTIGDNHEKPEAERFTVRMKAASVETRNTRIKKFMNQTPEKIMAQMMDGSSDIKDLLTKHVVSFTNLTIDKGEDDTTQRPVTVDDLWNNGEFTLCLELFMRVLSHSSLTKDEVKNSKSPSGSPATNGEETTTAESAS